MGVEHCLPRSHFNRVRKIIGLAASGMAFLVVTCGLSNAQPPGANSPGTEPTLTPGSWQLRLTQTIGDASLTVPAVQDAAPAAGRRVAASAPGFVDTSVHHTLYLPADWSDAAVGDGHRWPVIVEYTGNYYPAAGSTGRVEDARLGFGLSAGKCIWIVLPFVDRENQCNAVRWWGDVEATVDYALQVVPQVCERYGGDSSRVLLCGFSRGAIARSFIGLHDDRIARLWCGMFAHDHFDGVRAWNGTTWGTPLAAYRAAATRRIRRLGERPLLVSQHGVLDQTRELLGKALPLGDVTYLQIDTERILGEFPNQYAVHPHNDAWLLVDSPARREVWRWLDRVFRTTEPAKGN